jgi:hypothetical protein
VKPIDPDVRSLLADLAAMALAIVVGLSVAAIVAGCTRPSVGPFLPPHPVACSSDVNCGDHDVCRFPCRMPDLAGNTCRAVCMPGENDIADYPTEPQ